MPTITDALGVIGRMFTSFGGQAILDKAENSQKLFTFVALLALICVEVWQEYLRKKIRLFENRYVRFAIYVCLFSMILCMGVLDSSSFIYVSF